MASNEETLVVVFFVVFAVEDSGGMVQNIKTNGMNTNKSISTEIRNFAYYIYWHRIYTINVYDKSCLRAISNQYSGNTLDTKTRRNRHEPYETVALQRRPTADKTAVRLRFNTNDTVEKPM